MVGTDDVRLRLRLRLRFLAGRKRRQSVWTGKRGNVSGTRSLYSAEKCHTHPREKKNCVFTRAVCNRTTCFSAGENFHSITTKNSPPPPMHPRILILFNAFVMQSHSTPPPLFNIADLFRFSRGSSSLDRSLRLPEH